jgi:hypothetical protein
VTRKFDEAVLDVTLTNEPSIRQDVSTFIPENLSHSLLYLSSLCSYSFPFGLPFCCGHFDKLPIAEGWVAKQWMIGAINGPQLECCFVGLKPSAGCLQQSGLKGWKTT